MTMDECTTKNMCVRQKIIYWCGHKKTIRNNGQMVGREKKKHHIT